MRNNSPRPNIENHYHIKELIERQTKRSDDRTYHQDKAKALAERDSEIRVAKGKETKPFFCTDCNKDFVGEAFKQVETDWTNPLQNIAFYKTKCVCGKWAIRLITDKHKDSYWIKSRAVRKDQGEHYADTIQPYQTNFNLLYGK